MRARTWESVLPLQSSSSLILASISREGDSPLVVALFFILFAPHSAVFLSCEGTSVSTRRHCVIRRGHPQGPGTVLQTGVKRRLVSERPTMRRTPRVRPAVG